MDNNLVYITGNAGKAAQVSRDLNFPFDHQNVDILEIQSLDLMEVVEHKARAAYEVIKKPVLVDDIALSFNALKRLPGTLIRHFIDEIGNEGLCKILDGFSDRTSTASVAFAFFDGKLLKTFYAELKGETPDETRGAGGFGWDPIFIPEGHTKTYAEMDEGERNRLYVRHRPMKEIEEFLKDYFKND